jgi:two-component system, NtrC family, nitrogen regulation sensor histidine kinase GlnL
MSSSNAAGPDALARQLVDQLTVGVVVVDADDRVLFINTTAQSLLAVSDRQAIGMPVGQCLRDDGALLEIIDLVRSTGVPRTQRETRLPINGDVWLTVDLSVNTLGDDGALLFEVTPLDRRLRIDRERRQLSDYETVRQLVRGLAHEVKNPLGGLRGAAQLLARELPDAGLREYTDVIIAEADRLRRLVDGLIGPTTKHTPKRTNVHWILERVRQLVEGEAGPAITLVRDYDPSIPDMLAEPDRLIQAVLNIARNAMQALGESGTIRLRTRTQSNFTIAERPHRMVLRIDIEDDGPGIAPAIMDRIFFPMITTKPSGVGMGLAIAQSLVFDQGGLIECHSVVGNTCFTIWLPLEPAND